MNREYGLTDQMHECMGAIMFFSFFSGLSSMMYPRFWVVAFVMFFASSVLVSVFLYRFFYIVAEGRMNASRNLFPSGFPFRKWKFIEVGEFFSVSILCMYCGSLGCFLALVVRFSLLDDAILFYSFLMLMFFTGIPIITTHYEIGRKIHRNDLIGVTYVRKHKIISDSLKIVGRSK